MVTSSDHLGHFYFKKTSYLTTSSMNFPEGPILRFRPRAWPPTQMGLVELRCKIRGLAPLASILQPVFNLAAGVGIEPTFTRLTVELDSPLTVPQ